MRARLFIASCALAAMAWAVPSVGAAHFLGGRADSHGNVTPVAPRPARLRHDDERGLVLRVWINGQGPYLFALDTGAGLNLVSNKVTQAARLPVRTTRTTIIGGLSSARSTSNREVVINQLAVGEQGNKLPSIQTALIVFNLPPDIDGVLDPTAAYAPHGYIIDMPNQIIAPLTAGSIDPRAPTRGEGAVVSWQRVARDSRPFVRLGDGRTALVDTGSGFGLAVSDRNAIIVGGDGRNRSSQNVRDISGGTIVSRRVSPTTINIGSLVLRGIPTDILFGVDKGAPVILGRDALYPFRISFDPQRRLISFETSKASEQRPETDDVIRVDTNLVNTLFTAVDRDRRFITSLRTEDIRIYENDVAQAVSIFERETHRPLSLAILIDTSESQRGVLAEEKRAARAFVDMVIRPNIDQAAVISFTGEPKVEQQLTNDPVKLQQGIERVRIELSPENQFGPANDLDPLPKEQDPSGYTSIWDAMWDTIDHHISRAPEQTRRAIILLSDGDDTSSNIKRQDVIDLALKTDVVVYSIGIRDRDFPVGKLDSGALKKVSERTGGRAFFPAQPDDLRHAFARIDEELRSQYLIAYSPTNANRDGSYRRIRIEIVNPELRKNKVRLLYRQGYYARKN